MREVMIDLETLGKAPGCVILSIGAVGFDLEKGILGPTFYEVINTASCEIAGLKTDPGTIAWWDDQSREARKVIEEAKTGGKGIRTALPDFGKWAWDNFGSDFRPWGNGAGFDQPILAAAYRATKTKIPWEFWNEMCHRTIKNLNPHVKMTKRQGTYHNALDDAISQAVHLLEIRGFKHDDILASLPKVAVDEEEEDLIG